jgi:hypothetical protein
MAPKNIYMKKKNRSDFSRVLNRNVVLPGRTTEFENENDTPSSSRASRTCGNWCAFSSTPPVIALVHSEQRDSHSKIVDVSTLTGRGFLWYHIFV